VLLRLRLRLRLLLPQLLLLPMNKLSPKLLIFIAAHIVIIITIIHALLPPPPLHCAALHLHGTLPHTPSFRQN
jgi:hypothetical protein